MHARLENRSFRDVTLQFESNGLLRGDTGRQQVIVFNK